MSQPAPVVPQVPDISILQKEITSLKNELSLKETKIKEQEAKISELNKTISEKLASPQAVTDQDTLNHLGKLKEVLTIKEKKIEQMEKDAKDNEILKKQLQEKIISLEEIIKKTDDKKSLEEMTQKLKNQEEEIQKARERIVQQQEENKNSINEISQLTIALDKEKNVTAELQRKNIESSQALTGATSVLDQIDIQGILQVNFMLDAPENTDIEEIIQKAHDESTEWQQKYEKNIIKIEKISSEYEQKIKSLEELTSEQNAKIEEECKKHEEVLSDKDLELETKQNKIKELQLELIRLRSAIDRKEVELSRLSNIIKQLEQHKLDLASSAKKTEENLELLQGDLEIIKSQYKEQQGILLKRETKMGELSDLASRAIESAEKYKEETKEKEQLISMLNRQIEEKKRHLNSAQNKIKMLSQNVVGEMTKQLEMKIKETEVLKEMLKSAKIEIMGKDKQIKRVRAKMSEGGNSGLKPRGGRKIIVRKEIESSKEIEDIRTSEPERQVKTIIPDEKVTDSAEAKPLKTASDKGENYFFKQNLGAIDMEELGNMKDLSVPSREKPGELSGPVAPNSFPADISTDEKPKGGIISDVSPTSGISGDQSNIQPVGGSFMGDADK